MKSSKHILIGLLCSLLINVYSQCGPGTPSFTVNLIGQPNGTYISPVIQRNDTCCGAMAPDVCLKFTIFLDPNAMGINFGIASGAVPPGALFYQINCGPPIAVGTPICLSGAGPHVLTFCKPGNNNNTYSITSIPAPVVPDSITVSLGCTQTLAVSGFSVPTISWTSVAPGATGAYNSYLNCTAGCATVMVTPTGTPPAYVDYQVSGFGQSPCQANFYKDTVRVYFYGQLLAGINPTLTTICFGSTNATLTSTVTGGLPPYTYSWSPVASSGSVVSVGPGTYTVSIVDQTGCPAATATAVVNQYTLPISANAGPNQVVCKSSPTVALSGTVTNATGGIWSGGGGSFSPSTTSLNTNYIPTSGELTSGVQLYLTTTGNSGCPAKQDTINISFQNVPTANAGPNFTVCANNSVVNLSGSIGGFSSTGAWTSSGSGIFTSTTNLNTTYTPGSGDISAGSVNIFLTSTGNGVCPPAIDTANIIITPSPTVNAGTGGSICSNSSFALNGTVIGGSTTGNWTTSGNGTFSPSSAALNAVYIPGSIDIAAGTVTLTLTSTNNGNCIPVSDTLIITIKQLAVVNAGPNQALCSNAGSISLGGNVSGGSTTGIWTASGPGGFSPGNTNLNASYAMTPTDISNGSVTFTLTSTGNGVCPAVSDTVRMSISQLAIVNAGANQALCSNAGTISLSGIVNSGSNTGIWLSSGPGSFNPSNSVLSTTYSMSPTDIANGSVTFTLMSTNNGPCPAITDTVKIVIGTVVTASVASGPAICSSTGSVALTSTVTGLTNTGIWTSSGTGAFNPGNTSLNSSYFITPTDIANGFVSFTLTSTNNGPCPAASGTASVSITTIAAVNAGLNQNLCSNQGTIALSGTVTGVTGQGNWISSGTGPFIPVSSTLATSYSFTPTDVLNGSVTFTLTSTNNGPCPAVSDTVRITIRTIATVTASANTALCSNTPSVAISGMVNGVTNTGIWASSGSGAYNPSNSSVNSSYFITPTDISNGFVTFTLTSTNNGPCPAVTDTAMVIITPLASVNAGPNQNLCSNQGTIALSGSVTGVSGQGMWTASGAGSFNPNNTSLANSYSFTPADITNGSVTFTLASANNGPCPVVTDTVTITIKTIATVNAGPSKLICSNTPTINLNGTISGSTNSGQWTTDGSGTFLPGSTSLNNSYFITVADVAAAVINFTLTSTNNGPCPAVTDTTQLTINQLATVNAGPNQALCSNVNSLSLGGIIGGGTSTGIWSSNGTGTFTPDNSALNASYAITTTDINNGAVTFTLSSTNNGACPIIRDTVRISIKKLATVVAGPDQNLCSTNSVAPFTGTVGGGTSTGIWTTTGGGSFSPGNTFLSGNYNISNSDKTAGTVLLILTSTNNGVCPAVADTMVVKITPLPSIAMKSDTMVCANNNPFPVQAVLTGGSGAITWTTTGTGNIILGNNAQVITYSMSPADITAGFVKITFISTNNGGCGDISASINVTINPAPTAAFVASSYTVQIPNDPVTFSNQSVGATTYAWNFGDGGSSIIKNPIHNYSAVGFYNVDLVAVNQFGCKDSVRQLITAISDIVFPNVFTPNTSGPNGGAYNPTDYSNDVFFPYTQGVTDYRLRIFNRWGELIFESQDIKTGWDGYFNGKLCQQDAYVWQADVKFFDGRAYNKTGNVTLLR